MQLPVPARRLTMRATLTVVITLLVALPATSPAGARSEDLLQAMRSVARPLQHPGHLEPLLDAAGGARVVLLGEATHGTREFYAWRAVVSRRLVREAGFSFIAIEGDWSSLVPLDHYVRRLPGAPTSAREALLQIERWPRWVWANTELEALGEWLRGFNRDRAPEHRVGIHGIDLYAIWESLDAVQAFYQRRVPPSAARVRDLYRVLRGFDGDYKAYADHVRRTGRSAGPGAAWVVRDLAARYRAAPPAAREALFEALQHARVVEAGERYLAHVARPGPDAWNVRADHFERSVARLLDHYGPASRAIVWAHNTHVGDARATDMARAGEVNLGQLTRERHGADAVFILGLGTATGSVLAARRWEGPRHTLSLPVPRPDSLEAALLASGDGDRLLMLDGNAPAARLLRGVSLPHRAIGVVFSPERERWVHYVPTRLADRYDAFIFLPHTRALEALHAE